MRVNVAIQDDLLARLDEAADALSISRSAFISIAISQKLQQDDLMANLPNLFSAMQQINEKLPPMSEPSPASGADSKG